MEYRENVRICKGQIQGPPACKVLFHLGTILTTLNGICAHIKVYTWSTSIFIGDGINLGYCPPSVTVG